MGGAMSTREPKAKVRRGIRWRRQRDAFNVASATEQGEIVQNVDVRPMPQSKAHHGRTTAPHDHLRCTAAGTTKPHPIATKPKRAAARKVARASRKGNRR